MSLSDPTTRTSARARAAARPDQALEKALSHPLRWQILALLGEGTRTPAAIARELGVRTENVSYHVRVLSDLELIELVGTTPVRGTLEHH
jgi:DNA-binding transcriptional ArsR family regulator